MDMRNKSIARFQLTILVAGLILSALTGKLLGYDMAEAVLGAVLIVGALFTRGRTKEDGIVFGRIVMVFMSVGFIFDASLSGKSPLAGPGTILLLTGVGALLAETWRARSQSA